MSSRLKVVFSKTVDCDYRCCTGSGFSFGLVLSRKVAATMPYGDLDFVSVILALWWLKVAT
jgi:hypothetical protein